MVNLEPIDFGPGRTTQYLNTHWDMLPPPKDFVRVPPTPGTIGKYTSMDPRLIDVTRSIRMNLDRPPYQPSNLEPIRSLNNPGIRTGVYPSYESIQGGNVLYYVDPDIADVYSSPVFTLPSTNQPEVFQDPMGSLKPQYNYTPRFQNNVMTTPYSSDQDQLFFREDLMALQARKSNQTDFSMYHLYF